MVTSQCMSSLLHWQVCRCAIPCAAVPDSTFCCRREVDRSRQHVVLATTILVAVGDATPGNKFAFFKFAVFKCLPESHRMTVGGPFRRTVLRGMMKYAKVLIVSAIPRGHRPICADSTPTVAWLFA